MDSAYIIYNIPFVPLKRAYGAVSLFMHAKTNQKKKNGIE
jgi:hypothetical protein